MKVCENLCNLKKVMFRLCADDKRLWNSVSWHGEFVETWRSCVQGVRSLIEFMGFCELTWRICANFKKLCLGCLLVLNVWGIWELTWRICASLKKLCSGCMQVIRVFGILWIDFGNLCYLQEVVFNQFEDWESKWNFVGSRELTPSFVQPWESCIQPAWSFEIRI